METTFSNGHALLIGVGGNTIEVTVKDAEAIHDLLIDSRKAAYPHTQVELLTKSSATRENILSAFDTLIERVNHNPDATVIIYYSGHGGRIESTNENKNEYFLVPHGYQPNQKPTTTISGLEFTKKIEAIKARKLIVFLDCCHAGGVPALKTPDEVFVKSPVPPELLDALGEGRGRVVVASSQENEFSYTGEPYSVFTACLLEALQGKATGNQDGYARILETLSYLFEQVPLRTSHQQHPFVNKILDLEENFPICYYAGGSKLLSQSTSFAVEAKQELNDVDRETLTELLQLSRRAASEKRRALSIEIGINPGELTSISLLSENDFAVELIDLLHKRRLEAAICKLCKKLESDFKGGGYSSKLGSIIAKLNCQ